MSESLHTLFSVFPDWLHVFLISAVPVVELRGAIPYGILLLDMNYLEVLCLSILGSLLPAPLIMYTGVWIFEKMEKANSRHIRNLAMKMKTRSLKKSDKIVRYSYFGLMLFIAIPLPGTGVWTGCIIASLLGLRPIRSVLASFLGTSIAGVIVTILVKGGVMLTAI